MLDKRGGFWLTESVQMIAEFPFVESLPKREKSRVATLWDRFQEVKALTEVHGMLVPCQLAANLLGVSHQRVCQLMEAGKLERVDFGGHPFVTENSLHEHARSERKNGRPPKVQTVRDVLKLASKSVK